MNGSIVTNLSCIKRTIITYSCYHPFHMIHILVIFIRLNLVILVKQPKHIIIIPSFYIFENTVHICRDYIVNLESREPAKLFIQYP